MAGTSMNDALPFGAREDPLAAAAAYFEYSRAANPIEDGAITKVPVMRFGAELYRSGPSKVVPLDLSAHLGVPGPATSPALCSNFVRVLPGDDVSSEVNASSQLFYVMHGRGQTEFSEGTVRWSQGDFFTLPATGAITHRAHEECTLYWVHDEPLLRYLGASAVEKRFAPTHYRHTDVMRGLNLVAADPEAAYRSRVSVLLANKAMDQTLTITHVLWAMFGLVPKGALQPPHRHQSVALDLVLDCQPGCYTLLGDLDESGEHLINTERVDWEPGAAFVTPPGRWHSHHNDSGADAHIIPIQDAGLHTYLRSLDIRFMSAEQATKMFGHARDFPELG